MPNKNNYQKMSQLKQKNNAFTLLELLVVISIIGILIALGIVSFSTAQQKSRDARRRGDIKAMQQGFEQYYAENKTYTDVCSAGDDFFPGGQPKDPKNDATYFYDCDDTSTSYCVCAHLETGGGNATGYGCADYGTTTDGSHYCLTNLQ